MIKKNPNGCIRLVTARATEIPDVTKNPIKGAKSSLVKALLVGTTAAHEVIGCFRTSSE